MNKRDVMFSVLEDNGTPDYVPAAFFLHFAPEFHQGQAAIDKHLEYFRYTDMDLLKIQYELSFPRLDTIQTPTDWEQMPHYGLDFFQPQLDVVAGLVKAAKSEAVIVVTLYSPFMCARQAVGEVTLLSHLEQDPDHVKNGLEIVTDSLLLFVHECIKLGVDGFYHSTQGGEAGTLPPGVFVDYVKPFDLTVMYEINNACPFNILHVCDYEASYDDFAVFADYPGDVVSCPFHVDEQVLSPTEVAQIFDRPVMGGLERKGVVAQGPADAIRTAARDVLEKAPVGFVLGADCTVPAETPWDNLKVAIDTAHQFRVG